MEWLDCRLRLASFSLCLYAHEPWAWRPFASSFFPRAAMKKIICKNPTQGHWHRRSLKKELIGNVWDNGRFLSPPTQCRWQWCCLALAAVGNGQAEGPRLLFLPLAIGAVARQVLVFVQSQLNFQWIMFIHCFSLLHCDCREFKL